MTGTYLVAAQLSLHGFIATITSRNAPAIDILVYHPETSRTCGIQIKTTATTYKKDWTMDNPNKHANLFYVFVILDNSESEKHSFYVINSMDIPKLNDK